MLQYSASGAPARRAVRRGSRLVVTIMFERFLERSDRDEAGRHPGVGEDSEVAQEEARGGAVLVRAAGAKYLISGGRPGSSVAVGGTTQGGAPWRTGQRGETPKAILSFKPY